MKTLPKIESLELVSFDESVTDPNVEVDITWFLIYTGTLFFCVGGRHHSLYHNKLEVIPNPPPPHEDAPKTFGVIAAGRIKSARKIRLHLWGSKDLGVETPEEWKPALKKILEEQVIPQALAIL